MKVAYLFPGQGAQEPGMLHALPNHPAVAATLAAAPTPDDADALRSTVNAQLALYSPASHRHARLPPRAWNPTSSRAIQSERLPPPS